MTIDRMIRNLQNKKIHDAATPGLGILIRSLTSNKTRWAMGKIGSYPKCNKTCRKRRYMILLHSEQGELIYSSSSDSNK